MIGSSFDFAIRSTLFSARITGSRDVLQQPDEVTITRARLHRYVHDQRQQIHVAHGLERDIDHSHVHAVRGLVHARRVHEDDLPIRIILDADDAGSRRLGLVRYDGELVTDDAVEQCGLARIGAADEGNEA